MVLAAQAHGLISILLIRHKVKMKTFKQILSEIKTIETKKLTGKDRPYTGKPNYGGEPKAPNVNAKKKSVKEEVKQVEESRKDEGDKNANSYRSNHSHSAVKELGSKQKSDKKYVTRDEHDKRAAN